MTDDTDFQKLLSNAPMAPNAERVTLVGMLARTEDATKFMLTLADGQSVTLDVDAVSSAKTLAGSIGQSMVELELDAERVPENLRNVLSQMPITGFGDVKLPPQDRTGVNDMHTGVQDTKNPVLDKNPNFDGSIPWREVIGLAEPATLPGLAPAVPAFGTSIFAGKLPVSDNYTNWTADISGTAVSSDTGGVLTGTHVDPVTLPQFDDIRMATGDPLAGNTVAGARGGFGGNPSYLVPFVVAMPHQASPATIATLMQGFRGPPWSGTVFDLKHPWGDTSPHNGHPDLY